MMKLLNLDPYNFSIEAKDKLKFYFDYNEINVSENFNLNILNEYEIIFVKFSLVFDKHTLSHCSKLKYIVCPATGTDHIDQKFCDENEIRVVSLFNEISFLSTIHSSAEHTWALLMASYKRVIESFDFLKKESIWNRNKFQTKDLFGKTIGIIGYGRNGRKVARFALAFGMNIIVFDKEFLDSESKSLGIRQESLKNIFKFSNIIVVSISLNNETKNLINIDILNDSLNKPLLINTSRGEVVNEEDIIKCLENKKISGYSTDVLINEHKNNFLKDSKLFKYSQKNSNVIITPHIAGSNLDSWVKTDIFIVNKLIKLTQIHDKKIGI